MKKLLLTVFSFTSMLMLAQWQQIPSVYSTGEDCFSAFGKVLAADDASAMLQSSTDEGANWSSTSSGVPATGLNFGTLNGSTLYGFDNNNIYQSTNGTTWSVMSTNITASELVKSMCVINGSVFATASPMSGMSSKIYQLNGSTWTLKQSYSGVIYTVIRNLGGTLWAGTTNTLVMKSTNGGMTFAPGSGTLNPVNVNDKYVFCLGETSGAIFFGNFNGKIMKSTDGGSTWTISNNFNTGSSFAISDMHLAAGNRLMVACDSGFVYTTDNGNTWGKKNDGFSYQTWDLDYQLGKITTTTNYVFASAKNGKLFRRPLNQIFSGIEEYNIISVASKCYPNPANGNVTIESDDLMFDTDCEVKLNDVLGREIKTVEMKSGKATLNVSELHEGVYSYTIYQKNLPVGKGKLVIN